jgi:hypothetical protein
MKGPDLRPRFRQELSCPATVVIARFQQRLSESEAVSLWSLIHHHMVLCIPEAQRHFWSPILDLHIDPLEAPGPETLIWGHFGPHPNVWTLFTALYAACGFTTLIGLMFGIAQCMARESPTGLLLLPIGLFGLLMLWCANRMGQTLAREQILALKNFFDETLCEPEISISSDPERLR